MFVLRQFVFALSLLASFPVGAEQAPAEGTPSHSNVAPGAAAGADSTVSATRPSAETGTLDNAIKILTSRVFPLSPSYVEDRYKAKLPEALSAAQSGNWEPIGTIAGWLFARLPEEQDVKDLVSIVMEEKTKEESKPETERNKQLIEYQKALLWGAKVLRGDEIEALKKVNPPAESYEKFKAAFLAAFDKQAEGNKEFAALMERAKKATTKEEREAIKKELASKFEDTGAYLGWNAVRGREEISGALFNTLATLNQSTGNHYMDMTAPDGTGFRIISGSDPTTFGSDVVKLVQSTPKLKEKMGNWTVAPQPMEVSEENTFASNGRKIEKWRADAPQESVAQTAQNQPAGGGGDDAGGASRVVDVGAELNARCNGCHSNRGFQLPTKGLAAAVNSNRVFGPPGMQNALRAARNDSQLAFAIKDWSARNQSP